MRPKENSQDVSLNTPKGSSRLSGETPKVGAMSQLSEKSVQGAVMQETLRNGAGEIL